MNTVALFWSYAFIRFWVYVIMVGSIGVLVFLGVSSGIVSRRTRKTGKRGAFTIAELDSMSHKKEVKV